MDYLALLVAKCLSGFTHFVISKSSNQIPDTALVVMISERIFMMSIEYLSFRFFIQ